MRALRTSLLSLFVLCAAVALGQGEKPMTSLVLDKSTVAAGSTITGHVTITFASGYHAYQNPPTDEFEIPLKFETPKGSIFKLVKVAYPKGQSMTVAGADKPTAVYTDTIVVPFTVKAPSKAGAAKFTLDVNYQQCNDMACMPPDTIELTSKVTVKAAAKATKAKKKG